MSSSKKQESSSPPGLARLPPGRHGLSREFVKQNQRDRLTAGTIAAVAERGYPETTISDIVKAAGLSRRSFYVYYASKEACYLSAAAEIAAHLHAVAEEAASEESGWPARVSARIGAGLAALAANPDLATFLLIAPTRSGGELAEHYSAGLMRATSTLFADMPKSLTKKRPSAALEYSLAGGSAAIVTRMVEAGDGAKLETFRGELVELILGRVLGWKEAARLAA